MIDITQVTEQEKSILLWLASGFSIESQTGVRGQSSYYLVGENPIMNRRLQREIKVDVIAPLIYSKELIQVAGDSRLALTTFGRFVVYGALTESLGEHGVWA